MPRNRAPLAKTKQDRQQMSSRKGEMSSARNTEDVSPRSHDGPASARPSAADANVVASSDNQDFSSATTSHFPRAESVDGAEETEGAETDAAVTMTEVDDSVDDTTEKLQDVDGAEGTDDNASMQSGFAANNGRAAASKQTLFEFVKGKNELHALGNEFKAKLQKLKEERDTYLDILAQSLTRLNCTCVSGVVAGDRYFIRSVESKSSKTLKVSDIVATVKELALSDVVEANARLLSESSAEISFLDVFNEALSFKLKAQTTMTTSKTKILTKQEKGFKDIYALNNEEVTALTHYVDTVKQIKEMTDSRKEKTMHVKAQVESTEAQVLKYLKTNCSDSNRQAVNIVDGDSLRTCYITKTERFKKPLLNVKNFSKERFFYTAAESAHRGTFAQKTFSKQTAAQIFKQPKIMEDVASAIGESIAVWQNEQTQRVEIPQLKRGKKRKRETLANSQSADSALANIDNALMRAPNF